MFTDLLTHFVPGGKSATVANFGGAFDFIPFEPAYESAMLLWYASGSRRVEEQSGTKKQTQCTFCNPIKIPKLNSQVCSL
ncbi:MAG: hypothetical protein FWB74_03040 [Defluviitaleaceae bacterium]|nr:hypothetical protein [Defluviitaleaceae bacterium]